MLVEDDSDDKEFFTIALEQMNDVSLFDIVNNGKEALKRLRNSSTLPSVIFMDVNMPIMGGMECLANILSDVRFKSIPVIMLSSDVQLREKARKMGASGFVQKPNSPFHLVAQLRNVLTEIHVLSPHSLIEAG